MLKRKLSTIVIFAIVLIIYVFSVLVIPFEKFAPGWVGFGFTVASWVIAFAVVAYGFLRQGKLSEKIYSFPLLKMVEIYVLVQLLFSIAVFAINAFTEIYVWPVVLVCVIVMAAAVIYIITGLNIRTHLVDSDKSIAESTKEFKMFKLNVDGLPAMVTDTEARKKLQRLAEDFRYSDPVSSEATEEAERNVAYEIEVLKTAVASGDAAGIIKQAERVSILLAERNRICKANKG